MDVTLFQQIYKNRPKHNQRITHGFAYSELNGVEDYINRLIRCAELRYPPEFRFSHAERCTPQEEVQYATIRKNTRQYIDYSQNDVYLVKFFFTFQGKLLKPRYMYLPYGTKGGLFTLMGSTFQISAVLADIAISAGDDSVYVPLNLDKLTFYRLLQPFYEDGKRVLTGVIHSEVYHNAKKPGLRKTITAESTLGHYLFAKYGVTEAFRHFFNTDVVVGDSNTITRDNYPKEDWIICTSLGLKPYGVKTKFYQPTDLRIAIPRLNYNTQVASVVGAFFYVVDRFPDVSKVEYMDSPQHWRILLGHIIFASDESEGKLLNKIDAHMHSLDGYIDAMSQEWLAEDGVMVDNVYELFTEISNSYPQRTTDAAATSATMFGKRLMVLRYVLIDIIKDIFNMMFALQNAAKKGLTERDIENIFKKNFRPYTIFRINHKHGEVSSISSPSPCMSFKTTANMILQTNITQGTSVAKTNIVTSANVLHASISAIGQFNNLPKTEPTGRCRANPYMQIDERGITCLPVELEPLINKTQAVIDGKYNPGEKK